MINLRNKFHLVFKPVLNFHSYTKLAIVLLIDISLCIITVWFAFYLRLGNFIHLSTPQLWAVIISILLAIPVFFFSGIYKTVFRYSNWTTIISLGRSSIVYGLIYISIITAIGIYDIPRTIGIIQPLLLFFAVSASRIFANYWLNDMPTKSIKNALSYNALIYGAGNTGHQIAVTLRGNNYLKIAGFLDENSNFHGKTLNGYPIFSPKQLPRLIDSMGVSHVILAISSINRKKRNEILEQLSKYHLSILTLPKLTDIVEGKITISDLHELDIDDLLGREQVMPDPILLKKNISNKVVVITGAGGSIGSELCRQSLILKPSILILLDMSEYALYSIHSELESMQDKVHGLNIVNLVPILASTQNEYCVTEIIDTWEPDTIYHAAAYKHVPLVEYNIGEGIKNNVFGTLNLAKIAVRKKVSNFVLISTDKAVRPKNIMGASKRLAEICLQALFASSVIKNETKLSMVRFGNVIGSSGSVIPKFKKQISEGSNITLTHLDVSRFFMSIPEAAQLVIQASAIAQGGDVFILDMGKPIKIYELAKRMIELSGLTVCDEKNPDGDIKIIITGLRPGEKLHEELLLGDTPKTTVHPKISCAQDPFITWDILEPELEYLKELINQNDIPLILKLLKELVVNFKPDGSSVDLIYTTKNLQ